MAVSPDLLSRFIPLNNLSPQALDTLARQTNELVFQPGSVIFKQGDTSQNLYFLLAGEIARHEDNGIMRTLSASDEDARYALARTVPRLYTAESKSLVRIAVLAEALLEGSLGRDQAAAYEIFEYDGVDDPTWMWDILSQQAFSGIPPASLNTMFQRFEHVPCKAGDVIIQQGSGGDYYYLIREGRARVSRSDSGASTQILAELGKGDGFGEEALLSGNPRNATVTMLSDGLLMRLSRQDFNDLLRTPLVHRIESGEAKQQLRAGAQLLDVRLEDEFRVGTLRNSLNLPLYLLRIKAKSLDAGKKYIVFCQSEQRSTVAAFLLKQRGYDVSVLAGGLDALKSHTSTV